MSNDYDDGWERQLAKIKYGINSGHQKHDSAQFSTILLF